ncbi:MAG: Crp/Fnr family transcriptional regulator, partial [Vulcanimicrobiaceae bacterium]
MDSHPSSSAYYGGNVVLDRLSAGERENVLSQLSVGFEEEASVLRARDQPIDMVSFPIDAVYSVVVELAQGQMYEVGVIGRSGAVGAEIAIGARMASRTVLCQAAGRVAQLPSDQFVLALDRSRTFLLAVRESLRRQWFDSQQTVACNFAHTVEQRAARWILMTQDQVGQEHFPLRAEFLSIMLGVSKAAIHEPLAVLGQLGCIRYEADYLTILSRAALHDYACECYD